MRILVRVVLALGLLALAIGVVMGVATAVGWWSGRQLAREMVATAATQRVEVDRSALGSLPLPVAQYFDRVLPADMRPIRSARIRWSGEFQMSPGSGWGQFAAIQEFTSSPPGFVWDASIRGVVPLVPVRVRDRYFASGAGMRAMLGGVIPVVNQSGTPELAASALARWLGEAVWFPTALLPPRMGGSVKWDAIDDSTAEATVTDGAITVSAEFTFDESGLIRSMSALRYRDVEGTPVLTRFEGFYRDYFRHDGVLVPGYAEVAWLLAPGRFPYWRGRPTRIEFRR